MAAFARLISFDRSWQLGEISSGLVVVRSKRDYVIHRRTFGLLDLDPALPQPPLLSAKDLLLKITGVDLSRCPCCGEGRMIVVGDLPALSISPRVDSS
jgi:hypothetical protein